MFYWVQKQRQWGKKRILNTTLFHLILVDELLSNLSGFDRWTAVRPFLPLARQQTAKQVESDQDKGHTTLMKHDERPNITTVIF